MQKLIYNKAGFTPLEIGRLTATVYGRLRQIVSCAFIELKYPDAMRKRASLTGFTLVEVLASVGILITFLTAALVSFTSTQNLSEGTQQQAAVLQSAKAKLEEMRAMDFRGLKTWYEQTGADSEDFDNDGNKTETTQRNNRFTLYDSANKKYGIGRIVLTDVYNDDRTLTQPYLGAYDDNLSPTGDNWIQATPASGWKKQNHTSVVFDAGTGSGPQMWVLGGADGWTGSSSVWFSSDGVIWTQAASGPWRRRVSHTSVVFDSKIWVLGGVDGFWPPAYLNDVWSSSDGATWSEALPNVNRWSPRSDHASVVFDNKIWVLGGDNGINSFNDVWSSSDGQSWAQVLADNPTPGPNQWIGRSGHTAVVFDNKIWVIGGIDLYDGGGPIGDAWYSTDGATWTKAIPGPNWCPSIINHSSVVLDGRIWVLGNGSCGAGYNNTFYSYDGANWTAVTSNGWRNRINHTSVAFANKIWILGGDSGSGTVTDVWWAYGADRMYQVDITVSWRQRNGRIVGEDNGGTAGTGSTAALNGVIDPGEDANGNGILDSPVHITGLLANRGYPSQIYLGRE